MSSTSKKIVGGALALLFIVSIVNTQAIISVAKAMKGNQAPALAAISAEDQAAQVTSASSNCASVAPANDVYKTNFIDAGDQGDGSIDYLLDFKVKNRCNHSISVAMDLSRNMGTTYGVPSMAIVQEYLQTVPLPNTQTPGVFSVTTWGPYSYDPFYLEPDLYGSWSNGISQSPDGLVSIYGNELDPAIPIDPMLQWGLYYYNVPAGGSKNFLMRVSAHSQDFSPYPERRAIRAALTKFRWFKTSDLTNNDLLSANELKTYSVPSPVDFASSYIEIFDPANYPDNQVRSSTSSQLETDKKLSEVIETVQQKFKTR